MLTFSNAVVVVPGSVVVIVFVVVPVAGRMQEHAEDTSEGANLVVLGALLFGAAVTQLPVGKKLQYVSRSILRRDLSLASYLRVVVHETSSTTEVTVDIAVEVTLVACSVTVVLEA